MEATLTVMSGPARGTAYRLVSGRVKLGRGPDNDIVINDDPKVSRNHAEIVVSPRGIEIRDVSERNMLVVDGMECKAAFLNDNSTFALGETQFRFSIRAHLPAVHQPAQMPETAGWMAPSPAPGRQHGGQAKRRARPKNPMGPKILLIAVGLAALWLFVNKNTGPGTKTPTHDEQIEAEIKAAQELKAAAEARKPRNPGQSEVAYQQAQQAFVTGFRDYRKGQFERAQASFQACVSLQPNHQLCNRYLRLTQRRFDELVQYHMVLGRKYRDQNQYSACKSAFRNVMVMVKDPSSKRYQEAKANYEACSAQLEERF
jgi:hypothetical protein